MINVLGKLRKVVASCWAKNRVFRFIVMVAFIMLVIVLAFLWYGHIIFLGYYNLIYVIILTVFAVTAYKKVYARQFSAKKRKLILMACFVLGISIIILALLKQLGCY